MVKEIAKILCFSILGANLKIASQMPKPHSLQASGKHYEIVTLGSQNIKSVAMVIVVRRLKPNVN